MARPLRIEFPGALYHVTSRGNEQRAIYRDDYDRKLFLELLGIACVRFDWILSAYVLMSNHFHLLLQLTRESLSEGMKWLNGTYAQRFNRRHKRVGHLVQGRFHAPLIEAETYFMNVARYVVLNPVRAGIVRWPETYRWSSYAATAGLTKAPDWLNARGVLQYFGADDDVAQIRYRCFVRDGILHDASIWKDLVGQMYLGSDSWVEKMREKVEARPRDSEHPKTQRLVVTRAMSDVVQCVAETFRLDPRIVRNSHGGEARMLAAWMGLNDGRLKLSEIAAGLRVRSAGYVSRLIQRCESELHADSSLRANLSRCRRSLYGE